MPEPFAKIVNRQKLLTIFDKNLHHRCLTGFQIRLCITNHVWQLFISNEDQASNFKVAYIFELFWAQSCLMAAQQFYKVTYVSEEYNNFQDSKSVFMISDFKIPSNAFHASEFWWILDLTVILRSLQKKNSIFLSSVVLIVAQ